MWARRWYSMVGRSRPRPVPRVRAQVSAALERDAAASEAVAAVEKGSNRFTKLRLPDEKARARRKRINEVSRSILDLGDILLLPI